MAFIFNIQIFTPYIYIYHQSQNPGTTTESESTLLMSLYGKNGDSKCTSYSLVHETPYVCPYGEKLMSKTEGRERERERERESLIIKQEDHDGPISLT